MSSQQTPASASVWTERGCGTNSLLQTHNIKYCWSENHLSLQHQRLTSFVSFTLLIFNEIVMFFDLHTTVGWLLFSVPCRKPQFLPLTCWTLWRDRSPVKGRTIPGNGPNLSDSPDGDGLEGLVGSNVEPWGSLETSKTMLEQLYSSVFI